MNVATLIKELRKYTATAEVAFRDHDQTENEINRIITSAVAFNPETSFDPEFCAGVGVVLS